jgi:hypothetical protein
LRQGNDWAQYSGNGHYYKEVTSLVTGSQAMQACRAMGGYLVSLTDAAERDFVHGIMTRGTGWIGARFDAADAKFYWVSGERFGTYAPPWAPTNPSNSAAEGCVFMFNSTDGNDALWADRDCATTREYICESDC